MIFLSDNGPIQDCFVTQLSCLPADGEVDIHKDYNKENVPFKSFCATMENTQIPPTLLKMQRRIVWFKSDVASILMDTKFLISCARTNKYVTEH